MTGRLRLYSRILLIWFASTVYITSYAGEYTAFTAPFREIDIAAPEPGTLSEILVSVGQSVAAGDVVAVMDSQILRAVLKVAKARARAEGRVAAATASRDLRIERLEKLKKLQQSGNARPDELAISRAELAIANGELKTRRQEQYIEGLEAQKIQAQIDRRSLRSPIDGFITKINKDVAERVGLNASEPVLTVAQLNPLRIELFIAESELQYLTVGSFLPIYFEGHNEPLKAKIDYVVPTIDPESGTTSVMLLLPNDTHQIRSGARCTVSIPMTNKDTNHVDVPVNGELEE